MLPEARTEELVIQISADETLIYDLSSHRAHCLNQTSSLIWNNCDGRSTIELLSKKLNIAPEVIRLGLDELQRNGLLKNMEESFIPLSGISRRKFMIRAGAVSAVALPIITALTAPVAGQTASCMGTNGFVSGTMSPDTPQADGASCNNQCNTATPVNNAACCSNFGFITFSFDIGSGVCSCPGYQCN